ncbi:MAG TPA: DUF4157 domain-containing protein [Kofleriaceae bacterium]
MRERLRIAASGSQAEQHASDTASRASQRPPPRGAELTVPTEGGARALTTAGRAHFEPIVGASLEHVKIRVDAEADRVTELAHADAMTHRDSVYIPSSRFAPDTPKGHSLLAHELAHVPHAAAALGTVFRQPRPHYPSEDEQKELEELLGRKTQVVPPKPATGSSTATPPPATNLDPRTTLSDHDVEALAARLVPAFEQAMVDAKFETTGDPEVKLADAKAAFENTQKALSAINSKFGPYLERRVTLTDNAKLTTQQLGVTHQVAVLYGWDEKEPETFAYEVMNNFCDACDTALAPYTSDTQDAVKLELHRLVMATPALWQKVQVAAKHHVGGHHDPGTHKIRLTPYGHDPYANAVHELLHEFTHPAFAAAFGQNTTEVFTEYFTQEIVPPPTIKEAVAGATTTTTYKVGKLGAMRDAMSRSALNYQGDSPEESLRLAYFKGRLDLIGFRGTEDEEKAVTDAGGAVWDAATAAKELKDRNARMLAAQSPHSNQLGVGVYFPISGGSMLGMRYARVLHTRNPPYASSQLYLEGQVLGTLTADPRRVGAAIGLGFERQEPSYYVGGGARAVATGSLSGAIDPQVAAEPFFAAGFRAMKYVRVGAEAFALVPVPSVKDTTVGATVTLGVEW